MSLGSHGVRIQSIFWGGLRVQGLSLGCGFRVAGGMMKGLLGFGVSRVIVQGVHLGSSLGGRKTTAQELTDVGNS